MHACPGCRRHIRETECPFCLSEAPPLDHSAETPVPRLGLKRSVLVASVLAATGCSAPTPPYGIPPQDTAPVDSANTTDTPSVMGAYGIPPGDAGTD